MVRAAEERDPSGYGNRWTRLLACTRG